MLGIVLYARVGATLDEQLERGLRSRADDVAALVRSGATGLGTAGVQAAAGDDVAQVLGPDGTVVDGSPALEGRALLTAAEYALVLRGPLLVEREKVDWSDERIRLLARPVQSPAGETLVVVVGASTEARGDALESLLGQLLLLGPVAVLLASLAAYGLAASALRPVEAMRREAEAVSALDPGRRLTTPPAKDELSRLGDTLNAMLGRLEAALERERRFVADAGHELRTPIAALRTELELALRRERSPQELRDALESAAEETERLTALTEELLVLARAQSGEGTVRRVRVPVADLLGEVKRRFAERFGASGRSLDVIAPGALEAELDPDQIGRALGNLVENALVHGAGDVRLEAREAGDRVELHVVDGGTGFGPELGERAFEPFTRADLARSTPGTGLGLAIVAAVARAHGGDVGIESSAGGSDVWIALPAAS